MINIKPTRLAGSWYQGFALDYQTISSEFVGYDDFGHERFNTVRTELGELLLRLKYRSDKSVLNEIINVVVDFISNRWKIVGLLDFIIPVPPSKTDRDFQPVLELIKGISSRLHIPLCQDSLKKVKATPELKDIDEYDRRLKQLANAFTVDDSIKGKSVLLFDDLYRSGATFNSIASVLYNNGKVKKVYVLALTRTRIKR